MRPFSLFALIALAVIITGCGGVLSTEPLASKDDTLFDAGLLGTWFDQENTVITVTSAKPPLYEILVLGTDRGDTSRLLGRLVRFGEHQILDVTDAEPGVYSIQGHMWVYIEKKENGLQVQYLDSKWFQEKVQQSGLPQFSANGHPVITASTASLRELVQQYGLQPEARGDTMELAPFKKQ